MSSDEKSNEETLEIKDLQPHSKQVNTTVKVVSKGEEREVVSRSDGSSHRVIEFLIGDSTGSIYLTMWDDNIDKLEEGKNITIKNGYVSLFKGSMRLNIGRYGSFEDSEEGPAEANTENNMSDKQFEQERRTFRPRNYGDSRGRDGGSGYRRRNY